MISIRVTQVFGAAPATAMQAQFPAPGGTIGRGADNTLVLPDPSKHVSRQQALVVIADGLASIRCVSAANPVFVNGRELTNGQAAPLKEGDLIVVAGYEMRVQGQPEPVPAATGLGGLGGPAGGAATGGGMLPDDIFGDLLASARPTDSLPAMPRGGGPPGSDAFPSDLFGPAPASAGTSAGSSGAAATPFAPPAQPNRVPPGPTAPAPAAALPDDFNPFLVFAPAAANAERTPAKGNDQAFGLFPEAAHPGAGLGRPASAESLDSLFDLGAAKDPFGLESPLSAPASAPNTSSSLDPLEALSRPAATPGPAFADRGDSLQTSFRLPGGSASPPPPPSLQSPGRAAEAPLPAGAVLSWSMPASGQPPPDPVDGPLAAASNEHALTRPTSFVEEVNRHQAEAMERARRANPRYAEHRPGAGAANPAAHAGGAAASADGSFELLKAFLLGAGLPELPRSPGLAQAQVMTPELMRRIGELLKVSIQGTVDLLQARSVMKRELRSDVTMIVTKGNNPLKFAPDGASAIGHLLSPVPVKGFLEPVPAMRDALDDLLAHQLGVVAGMRAAMSGLVQRFDPAIVEDKLARKSMLDAMLSMPRKARLWELFTERYAELSREARDDLDAVFWQAFTRAYDEQIARVKAGAGTGEGKI